MLYLGVPRLKGAYISKKRIAFFRCADYAGGLVA